jgi:thymidylate kinase
MALRFLFTSDACAWPQRQYAPGATGQHPFYFRMTCDSREFFKLYFHELEKRSIPSVILHSYQDMPDKISSDIDYAVPDSALRNLSRIQMELARQHGWALVQTLQHGVFAFYAVLASLDDPTQTLRLDACSNYARVRRFLVPESILLTNRIPYRCFHVPSPAGEFMYSVTKLFDAKNKSPAGYIPRLKELWAKDPVNIQKYFNDVFGDTGRPLEQWFETAPDEWNRLRVIMLARNRFGPALMARESVRVAKRILRPTGVTVAALGSDGSGKSTLLENMLTLLRPCFRREQTMHFRPMVLGKRTQDDAAAIATPHARPPRNIVSSWLRVVYYFLDYWLGWFMKIRPAKIQSTLLIFDRHFDDMLVDERRYRLRGISLLVRFLRCLLPRNDRVFVLSAPAAVIHQRKPELSLEVLEHQQRILQQLAARNPRFLIIPAEQSAEQVARQTCLEVLRFMAAREEKRH